MFDLDNIKHSQSLSLNQKESHSSDLRKSRDLKEYDNYIDIQLLKKKEKLEKHNSNLKKTSDNNNKNSGIIKEIIQIDPDEYSQSSSLKKSKTRIVSSEYKLNNNKEEVLNEIKIDRKSQKGAIYIEKLNQPLLKLDVIKPPKDESECEPVFEKNQIISTSAKVETEIAIELESKINTYEFMLFEDDFKNLIESMNLFIFVIYSEMFLF